MEGRAAGVPAEVLQSALDQVHAGLGPKLESLISGAGIPRPEPGLG